ncbi:MAG: PKD domain-containing protein, partial [Bacteroidales bacterium]|nr:PKD domain-containing protein [Bacteroidales bacterium]
GVNVLNIRVRDENKLHSSTLSKVFYKMPNTQLPEKNLSTYEFWFNHDYESRQVNNIQSGSETHIFTQIDISDLPDGVNVLNIRCSDENNLYSSTLSKLFYKIPQSQLTDNNLTTYELWFNNDYENRQENSLVAHTNHHILAEIDVSDLPVGVHVVNIRVKDENKLYSSTLSKVFYKMEQDFFAETTLSGYNYWFDEDYENAVFSQFQTPVKQFSILDDFDVTHLPMGEHTVHFQFLDEKGKWSVIKSNVFTKTAIPEAIFSVDNEIACANAPLLFINESIEADSFLWDFGDGNTSGEFEPEHIYAEVGEYQVVLTAIDLDSGRENETSQLITVEDCSEVYTILHFNPGWNLFSMPAEPETANLKELFQPLIDNGSLLKIQDEAGNALEDWGMIGGWKNFIGDISPTEGYKIRVAFEDELEVSGLPPNYPFAIPLSSGWNIMGFPHTSSFNALKVLQPLIDNGTL